MSYWDIIKPWTWPGHFVGGLETIGEELTSQDPARKGVYAEAGPFEGVPGFRHRGQRLLEGRTDYSSFRGQQQDQVNRLLKMSEEGDPLARARLNQQAESNAAKAHAQALSMGPGNAALGARQAMQQGGAARMDAAGKGALADTAARLGATQQLTGALQGMRQQDQALNLGMTQMELQQALQQGQLGLGYENMLAKRYAASLGIPTVGEQNRAMLATGISQVGSILSDRRAKADVKDADDDADEFMDSMAPKSYRYSDEKANGAGRHMGVMAQDMERSRMGRAVVRDTPRGKVLDSGRLVSGLAASVVRLNDRLRKLEGK
jgi:hypothetical protein